MHPSLRTVSLGLGAGFRLGFKFRFSMLLASVVQPSTHLLCECHITVGGRISFQKCSSEPIAIKTIGFYCPKDNELKTQVLLLCF